MIQLIDRYLFWSLLRAHISLTLVLVLIVWLVQTLRLLAELPIGSTDAVGQFLLVSVLQLPRIFSLCLAPTLLIVSLYQLVQKLQSHEYFALVAAGFSPAKIMRAAIALSLFVILVQAVLSFYVSPIAIQSLNRTRHIVKSNLDNIALQARVFREITNGVTVFAEQRNPDGSWQGILISVTDRNNDSNTTYLARNGRLIRKNSGAQSHATPQVGFVLNDGVILTDGVAAGQISFDSYVFTPPEARNTPPALYYLRKNDMMIHQLFAPRAYGITHQPSIIAMRIKAFELIGALATPLIFTLIAFACMTGGLRRGGYGRRITLAATLSLIFQIGTFYCANLAGQYNYILPIIVWPVLAMGLICLIIFMQNKPYILRYMLRHTP
ncbi:MAG: LptF/LptG family permease, partial [Parvibaculales bacterium]